MDSRYAIKTDSRYAIKMDSRYAIKTQLNKQYMGNNNL